MKVADLMQTKLTTVDPEAPVAEAVQALAESHISALPVVDGRGRLVGVISTTDILTAAAETEDAGARERLFADTMVKEIMTPKPLTIAPDAEVKEAAQQMLYAEVHRLFVEEGGQLVGVISQSDIVRAVALAKI
ncbi:MAG: membrane protein [Gemmatimonadales bacterium]|nr:Inosine-5'-monophosphate dehydrogenase [bacterium HR33]GIW52155.1 MAG: membrane protein [Gemmatimonadales bacterium]